MIDPFGRHIHYLSVSVTDRCDFRCVYCMSEHMSFLPKRDLLSLEELERICAAFIRKGVKRIRITGGEPLVRRNAISLIEKLGARIGSGGLDELTLTTNGSQLARFAEPLVDAGVRRINVSLDTRDPERFRTITRWGDLDQVLGGIDAALKAGLKLKINMVALHGVNEDEIPAMHGVGAWPRHGHDADRDYADGRCRRRSRRTLLPLSLVRAQLAQHYTLVDSHYRTGGPARYVHVEETGGRLGFITPLTHNFCESCNRVRLPALACSTCVSAKTTTRICAPPCAPRQATTALERRHRRGHCAQTQRPRFHHRPPA